MSKTAASTVGTNGGPAFPHGDPVVGGDPGMSRRDYFAAHALQGLIAGLFAGNNTGWTVRGNVVAAYEYADAMLTESEVDPLAAVRDALHDFDISTEEREGDEKLSPREILDALTSFVVGVRHALKLAGAP